MYEKLLSLTSNKADINIYKNFCELNRLTDKNANSALHHILPRAIYPEYANLKKYPENGVILSNDNHYLAHAILHKIIENISIASAWYAMNNMNYIKDKNKPIMLVGEKLYGELIYKRNKIISDSAKGMVMCKSLKTNKIFKVPKYIYDNDDDLVGVTKGTGGKHLKNTVSVLDEYGNSVRVSIFNKKFLSGDLVGHTIGYGTFKDANGTIINCKTDDAKVLTGELVGVMKNSKRSNEYKQKLKEFRKLHPESGNAKYIIIYHNNSKYFCHGTFKQVCKKHDLPLTYLYKSYRNEIKDKIRDDFSRQGDYTRYLNKKEKYKNIYAKEVTKDEYFLEKKRKLSKKCV